VTQPFNQAQSVPSRGQGPSGRAGQLVAFVMGAVILASIGFFYDRLYPGYRGELQPIPFSHRVHAREKHISCVFCHSGATDTARAGVPPLETCMLCHKHIAINYQPIKDLRDHYYSGTPVRWEQIYWVPDFVYFDHSMHIHRQIDCGKCHGNVMEMDRIVLNEDVNMGYCIGCHKDYGVTHDCFTCHR
jgi:hypothetical protein